MCELKTLPATCACWVTSVFVASWTVGCQVPLSTGFSRQEYWRGLPCLPPGDIPDPGMESISLLSPASSGEFFTTRVTWGTCHISKQRMLQSSSHHIRAVPKGQALRRLKMSKHRILAPDRWVYIKGMISVSLESCIFPYIKN